MIRRKGSDWRMYALLLLSFGLYLSPAALSQKSPSYVMERVTVTSSAASTSSVTFDMLLTFGEEGPTGSASFCNGGFQSSLGFWSVLGESPAPSLLMVDHNGGDPQAVDLTWSGSASSFDVLRSEVAPQIQDPLSLQFSTTQCEATDAPPTTPNLLFYRIRPASN